MVKTGPVNVGVIGAGVGRLHVAAYHRLGNARVVALAGLDTKRCRQLAAEYGIPRLFSDYQELLAQEDVEAVSVCTPNYLHAPMAIEALRAGKHVLCEKPLALSVAEAEAIVMAAREANRKLMVTFNYRFRGDSQTLKRHIEAGGLGEIYYAKVGWLRRSGIPGIGSWFTKRELSGGGPLIDLGLHVLDLALWLMGHPRVVSVSGATYAAFGPMGKGGWDGWRFTSGEGGFDVEDLATAYIRLDTGAVLFLEASWATYTGAGDDYYVHLFGTEGGAELTVRRYTHKDTLRLFGDMAGTPVEIKPSYPQQDGHDMAIEHFVDCIVNDREPMASGEQGIEIVRIIDAIYRAAETAREIAL